MDAQRKPMESSEVFGKSPSTFLLHPMKNTPAGMRTRPSGVAAAPTPARPAKRNHKHVLIGRERITFLAQIEGQLAPFQPALFMRSAAAAAASELGCAVAAGSILWVRGWI
jgi:hypothetical protein